MKTEMDWLKESFETEDTILKQMRKVNDIANGFRFIGNNHISDQLYTVVEEIYKAVDMNKKITNYLVKEKRVS